jgi:hypothetical protein
LPTSGEVKTARTSFRIWRRWPEPERCEKIWLETVPGLMTPGHRTCVNFDSILSQNHHVKSKVRMAQVADLNGQLNHFIRGLDRGANFRIAGLAARKKRSLRSHGNTSLENDITYGCCCLEHRHSRIKYEPG